MVAISIDLNCQRCPLAQTRKLVVRPEVHTAPPRVLFLGRDPGDVEDRTGRPFHPDAPAGKLLRQIIHDVGIPDDWVAFDNMVRCHTPKNRGPKATEVQQCHVWSSLVLTTLNPEWVVTLGQEALEAYTNWVNYRPTKPHYKLEEYHGPLAEELSPRLFPMYHPSAGLRNSHYRRLLMADMRKLAELLGVAHMEPCDIHHNSGQLGLTQAYGLDIETAKDGSIIGYALAWQSPNGVEAVWETTPDTLRMVIESGCTFVLHNSKFDLTEIERQWGLTISNYHDTLIAAHILGHAKNVDPGSLGLKELALKEFGFSWLGIDELGLPEEMTPEQVARYCCNDAAATLRLWEKYEKELKNVF